MEKIDIGNIDVNMKVETQLTEPDLVLYDIRRDPFDVYGLYRYREEPVFKRLPDEIGQNISRGVAELYLNTTGGRIRFSSDSAYVALRAVYPSMHKMSHMAFTGSVGFDLYVDDPQTGTSRYWRSFRPDVNITDKMETIIRFPSRKMRWFTVNFPAYSQVSSVHIGLQKDAALGHGMPYRDLAPVVYYGNSITQGGCASRPGNVYTNIISRHTNTDFINLGFSGSGCGEALIAEYMAGLKMSAFVSDYDQNAPDVAHLQKTHCALYQAIRAKHPDIPYIMLSMVDIDSGASYEKNLLRRDVVFETYRFARDNGDRNVYYIDGASIFRAGDADVCTVDGCHPTDYGFVLMAHAIEAELRRSMTQDAFR